jgi:hypothetical protein
VGLKPHANPKSNGRRKQQQKKATAEESTDGRNAPTEEMRRQKKSTDGRKAPTEARDLCMLLALRLSQVEEGEAAMC